MAVASGQKGEKEVRSNLIGRHDVGIPTSRRVVQTFPKYDDQVDSTAQAIKWISGEGREPAFITLMYMQIAADQGITVEEARERIAKQIHQDGF